MAITHTVRCDNNSILDVVVSLFHDKLQIMDRSLELGEAWIRFRP